MTAYPSLSAAPRRGFALLVTIVLVAFLVLILVGLASFTRVETSVAASAQTSAQARQNALNALNVALGDLQRFAGADQRATARADILATSDKNGSKQWTGVWGLDVEPDALYDTKPTPRLLNWLVSGNHGVSTPAVDAGAAGGTGRVTSAAATPANLPEETIANLATSTLPTATNLTVGGQPAVMLLGPGTAGTTSTNNYVVAPTVELKAPVASVPGLGTGSGDVPIGRYAYWVGDEGVKARYAVTDPNVGAVAGTTEWAARLGGAPRQEMEAMSGFGSYSTVTTPDREHVLNYSQVPLAQSGLTAAAWRDRVHDVTTASLGLLTDGARGGLREDLSYHRANPAGFTGDLLPASIVTDAANRPQKEKVLSYLNLDSAGGVDAAGVAGMRPGSNTQQGLFPIVVASTQLFAVRRDAANKLFIHYIPVFVLANPWNVTLTGGVQLHLEHSENAVDNMVLRSLATPLPLFPTYTTGLRNILRTRLRIASLNLAPGEARIYSLPEVGADAALSYPLAPPLSAPYPVFDLVNEFNQLTALAIDTGRTYVPATLPDPAEQIGFTVVNTGGNAMIIMQDLAGTELYRAERVGHGAIGLNANEARYTPDVNAINLANTRGIRTRFKSVFETLAPGDRDVRFIADYNHRSPVLRRANMSAAVPFREHPVHRVEIKNDTLATPYNTFIEFLAATPSGDQARWARSYNSSGVPRMVLYHAPRAARPVIGVGQLQHADLTVFSDEPSYALGGGLASPYVKRDAVKWTNTGVGDGGANSNYYDASYLLNTALLDGFLISNVPQTGGAFDPATQRPPFARYQFLPAANGSPPLLDDLRAEKRSFAARAAVEGAFNLNSTSVEAWKTQLAALRGLNYNLDSNLSGPLPRSPHQPGGSAGANSPLNETAWDGLRNLSAAEIDTLAARIVDNIKARGPALTVAHFANRALANDATGLRGRLQQAIEDSGINAAFVGGAAGSGANAVVADGAAEVSLYADVAHAAGPVAMGAPGWVGQHDILGLLAPIATTRSDTFVVRVYGEAINPVTQAVDGRAWGEAVVQRYPDYVDTADAATEDLPTLSATNQTMGRQFKVVSFRWLNTEDI